MDIYWQGEGSFRIKGKSATVLMDSLKIQVSAGDDTKIFEGPGEYESKAVVITGVRLSSGNIVYNVIIDGVSVVVFGTQQVELTEAQVQEIDSTDILLCPVNSANLVSQLEPKIIIPFGEDTFDKFLKEMGSESVQPIPKLTITKDKLPEEAEVVLLSKNG